jgi:hypothetical protein
MRLTTGDPHAYFPAIIGPALSDEQGKFCSLVIPIGIMAELFLNFCELARLNA